MHDHGSYNSERAPEFFADELPILGVGTAYLPSVPNIGVPMIFVDAAGRPDVMDLGRVLRLEPQGATASMRLVPMFQPLEGYVAFIVSLTSTLNCSLKLILRLPAQRQLAQSIVTVPKFVISPGPIDDEWSVDPARVIVMTCPDPTNVVRQAVALVDSWTE